MSLTFPPMNNQATIPITTSNSNILVTLTYPSTNTTPAISSVSGMVSISLLQLYLLQLQDKKQILKLD